MTAEPTIAVVARKQASRRKLLDAARRLFVELGYHNTRPQDIVREAGVGHGTFYLHFSDKLDCFRAFVKEAGDEIDEYVLAETQNAESFSDYIRGVFRGSVAYAEKNPGVIMAAMADPSVIGGDGDAVDAGITARWMREWTERLKGMIAKGQMAADLDPTLTASAIIGACHFAFLCSLREGFSIDQVTDTLVPLLSRGIATQAKKD
jgi:AcrR family transcriptional regulator